MATSNVLDQTPNKGAALVKKGNILKTLIGNIVLVTEDGTNGSVFEGVSLFNRRSTSLGTYGTVWSVDGVELFVGTITLTEG